MPRRKTRSSRDGRRRSLVFTESPLNASKTYCSPVLGAVHPITADAVPVDEDLDLGWVSPQFNPNLENSAPRRKRKGTRSRAACVSTSLSASSRPLLRKDTSQSSGNVPRHKQVPKALPKGFTCLNFVGDKETEPKRLPNAGNFSPESGRSEPFRDNSRPCTRSRSYSLQNVKSRRATSKYYGGRPMNCSVNESLNPAEFEVTQNAHDNQAMPHPENSPQAEQRLQRLHGPEENLGGSDYAVGLRRSSRTQKQLNSGKSSSSPKGTRPESSTRQIPQLSRCKGRHLTTCDNQSPSRCDDEGTDIAGEVAKRLLFGPDTRPAKGRVLACDTPEAEYGLKVSIRRRKDLLPLSARNKLLCP